MVECVVCDQVQVDLVEIGEVVWIDWDFLCYCVVCVCGVEWDGCDYFVVY